MKHYYLPYIASLIAIASCYEKVGEIDENEVSDHHTQVTLLLEGDFTSEYTRASLAEANITDLWVYDYDASDMGQGTGSTQGTDATGLTLLQRQHLTTGLDAPTLDLTHGKHRLAIIASRGTEPSADDERISWQKPHDTYAAFLDVDATGHTLTANATLTRRVSRLRLTITDQVPADAATLAMAFFQWGSELTPATLLSPVTALYTYTVDMTQMRSKTGVSISAYSLCPSADEWSTRAILTVTDADGRQLSSVTVPSVLLLQNRTTTLRGNLFSAGSTLSLSLDDTWIEDKEQNF